MDQSRLMIFLLVLLTQGKSLTSPLNFCPTFQIQSSSISSIPTPSDFSTPITATISLQNPQPDNSYQALATYQALVIPQIDYTISIHVWIYSQTSTSVTIGVVGQYSGKQIQVLQISYMIIPSAYNPYIYSFTSQGCFTTSCLYDFILNSGASVTLIKQFPTALSTTTNYIVGYLNSISVKISKKPMNTLGLSLNAFMLNSTHYSLQFRSISVNPILLQGYLTTIIAYKTPSTSYGLKITQLVLSNPNDLRDSCIATGNTFYGLKAYSFMNMEFQFVIVITSTMATKYVVPNMVTLQIQIISLQASQCCLSTPFLDSMNGNCTDICAVRYQQDSSTMSCQTCPYDCYKCSSTTACTSCNLTDDFRKFNNNTLRCEPIFGYYDPGVTTALPCSYPNCCGYTPVIDHEATSCLVTCPAGLIENHITRVCGVCDPGYWPVSGHCTNVLGCTSTIVNNGSVVCIFCGLADHFVLKNQTCVCAQGYGLDQITGNCIEVCGDGIYFSHKCDDNNTADGDGCSSACEVEDYFRCSSLSNYIPMDCAYVGNVELIFNTASKTEGKNQGVFSFGVTAKHARLNLTKIISSFVFNCDPHVAVVTMSVSSTQILLFVDYQEDLQGRLANVTFTLNPANILTSSLSVNFRMVSNREKLVVIKGYSTLSSAKKLIQIITLASLFVAAAGSLAYKMIGVELLHSFLLVYFTCLEGSSLTEPYLAFKNLRLLALNFNSQGNYYSQSNVFTYKLDNELFSKQVISLLLLALFTGIIAIKIVETCQEDNKNQDNKLFKVLRVTRHQLNSLLFLISIGYGYQALIPSFILRSTVGQDYKSYSCEAVTLVIFISVTFALLFFRQFNLNDGKEKDNESSTEIHKNSYTSVYLFFWFGIMVVFCLKSFYKVQYLEEYCLVFLLIFFIWFVIARPYQSFIHNAGQLFNLLTDVVFLSWSLGRKYFARLAEQDVQIYLILTTLLLMSISIVFAILRIIKIARSACQLAPVVNPLPQKQQAQSNRQNEKIQDMLQIENKYRIKSMLLSEEALDMDYSLNRAINPKWKRQLLVDLMKKYKINIREDDNMQYTSNSVRKNKFEE